MLVKVVSMRILTRGIVVVASERATDNSGHAAGRKDDDYIEYIADMILEMQGLAQRGGHYELAKRLLSAYEAARLVAEGKTDVPPANLNCA